MNNYDLIIIGGGPAGYAAAIHAGRLGKKPLLLEKNAVGGTCLNRGCIPTKYLIAAVTDLKKARENPFITGKNALTIDFPALIRGKDELVAKIVRNVETLVKGAGAEVVTGEGAIAGPGTVQVVRGDGAKEEYRADNILIATGSAPAEIPGLRVDETQVMSSTGFLAMKELPLSLLVIGGGAIGCECAYVMAVLGVPVTVVEMLDQILPHEDRIVAKTLENSLRKRGVEIMTGTKLEIVEAGQDGVRCGFGRGVEKIFDRVLVAVGRRADVPANGAGFAAGKFIAPGEGFQTGVNGIYAIGDVNGKSMYAHAAIAQGIAAVDSMYGRPPSVRTDLIPSCVFTQPEVASVGLSEAAAAKEGRDVSVARFPYAALGKAHAINASEGFFKMVADKATGKILGVQIVGDEATDLIGEGIALVSRGAIVADLASMVHPHPTLSEGYWEISRLMNGYPIHTQKTR